MEPAAALEAMTDHAATSVSRFRWPVSVTRPIAASADDVWAVISAPGNLEFAHPFCESNPVTEWPGARSRDEVHYLSGWVYERQFRRWIDGVGYDLDIGARGEKTSFVSWRIWPVDEASSTLTITVHPHVLQGIPAAIRWLPHAAYLRPMLRRYLSSVVQGFEWYVTRGEAVPRNQVGSHPWFSGRG